MRRASREDLVDLRADFLTVGLIPRSGSRRDLYLQLIVLYLSKAGLPTTGMPRAYHLPDAVALAQVAQISMIELRMSVEAGTVDPRGPGGGRCVDCTDAIEEFGGWRAVPE